MLDVSDRLVVVVGGGSVAVRKVQGLLEAGATRLRCVAPRFDAAMPPQAQRIQEPFAPHHLEGAGLVFAATDDAHVNAQVVAEARARGILVSRADADEQSPGDFSTPAVLRRGSVTVAVAAGGSPAVAAAIRDHLAAALDPAYVALADAMRRLRPLIRDRLELTAQRRSQILRELSGDEAVEQVRRGGLPQLEIWLAQRYPELAGSLGEVR